MEHAPFFFGREALTGWLVDALRGDNRFLAIIGPSGSGKSSLARAGLVAALKQGALDGSATWPIAIFRPGNRPLESLADALHSATGIAPSPSALRDLIESLRGDQRMLHLSVRLALQKAPPESRLLLLADQFEEVFTLCPDERERQALIDNLLYAASAAGGRTVVILAMRADFYPKCAGYPSLAAALSDHQVLVGPMTDEELGRAIETAGATDRMRAGARAGAAPAARCARPAGRPAPLAGRPPGAMAASHRPALDPRSL